MRHMDDDGKTVWVVVVDDLLYIAFRDYQKAEEWAKKNITHGVVRITNLFLVEDRS